MTRLRLFARASALALTVGLAGGAHAATADSESNSGATTVSGVTVNGVQEAITTAPVAPPLTEAYSEGTITSDTLRNISPAPMVTVQTMLNSQPSIFAYTNGPLGTGTNINFRAFNSGQFSETYDGVALNDVFNAGVTNQASVINNVLLLPSNIDSVQIFRGINNPAVNSYNSLGGTVNYLPRRPTDGFNALLGGSYGSFNTEEVHAAVNTGEFYGFKNFFAFNNASSDGWATPHIPDRNTNAFWSGEYDTPRGDSVNWVLIYDVNNGYTPYDAPASLLNGGYFQYPLDVGYERDRNKSWMGILKIQPKISENVNFSNKAFFGFNDFQRTSYTNPAVVGTALDPQNNDPEGWVCPWSINCAAFGGNALESTQYHFYGYKTWEIGDTPTLTIALPHNLVTLGGNVTYGNLYSREYWWGTYNMPRTISTDGNDAWDEHDHRWLASVYAQDEIKLLADRLSITPGLKFIYANTYDHDDVGFYYPIAGAVSDEETFLSPTIGINYKATDNIAVFFAFGRNVKFPDISAYYGGFQTDANGNPQVVPVKVSPEYVNDFELGARYQTDFFSAGLNLYREDFTNTFISQYDPATGLSSTVNGGASRYQGVELQLQGDTGHQAWGDMHGYLNFAYNDAKFTKSFTIGDTTSFAAFGSVTAGQPLAGVPDYLVTGGVVWSYMGWRLNAEGRYVGRQYLDQQVAGTPSSTTIPSYFLVDLGVSKTIDLAHAGMGVKAIKFSVNANNLFDKYYLNQGYTNGGLWAIPGAPRSVIGTIEAQF